MEGLLNQAMPLIMKKENLKMPGDSSIRAKAKTPDIQAPRDKKVLDDHIGSLDKQIKENQSLQEGLKKQLEELRFKDKTTNSALEAVEPTIGRQIIRKDQTSSNSRGYNWKKNYNK
jgi:hypothetical protein